ncbi:hypothetical protein [uncultured Draconibacterium sp.]|uniref:hypothetical protein n=1 Tax=uncultured Draconibacterium sp. TaxID=1573823 RepID=UPI0029C74374|nr:hypothetical protein [uncultured Draconibacterium sp.]
MEHTVDLTGDDGCLVSAYYLLLEENDYASPVKFCGLIWKLTIVPCLPAAFIFVLPQKRSKKGKAAFCCYPAFS